MRYITSSEDTPKTMKNVSYTYEDDFYDKKGNCKRTTIIWGYSQYFIYEYKYDNNNNLIIESLLANQGCEDYNTYRNFYAGDKLVKSIVRDSVMYDGHYTVKDSSRIITYKYDSSGRITGIKCEPKKHEPKKYFTDIFGSRLIYIRNFIEPEQEILYSYTSSGKLKELKKLEYHYNYHRIMPDTIVIQDDKYEYNLDEDTVFKFTLKSYDYFEYDSNRISTKYHYAITGSDTADPIITHYSYEKFRGKINSMKLKSVKPDDYYENRNIYTKCFYYYRFG